MRLFRNIWKFVSAEKDDFSVKDVELAVRIAFSGASQPVCDLCGSPEVYEVRSLTSEAVKILTNYKYICRSCAFGLGIAIIDDLD